MTTHSDFITRPATLDRWDVTLQVHDPENPGVSLAIAHGWCERKRGPLWTLVEEFPHDQVPSVFPEWIQTVASVCMHHGPTKLEHVERGMSELLFVQPELFE